MSHYESRWMTHEWLKNYLSHDPKRNFILHIILKKSYNIEDWTSKKYLIVIKFCAWDHAQLKGSQEESSDSNFWSSNLCDLTGISWWLISRSTQNRLEMTSPIFQSRYMWISYELPSITTLKNDCQIWIQDPEID